jgi:DegV family protein with EDD domain
MAELDINYICFHFYLDGKEYADDLGQSIPFDKFYQAMTDGADTKTAQVSSGEYAAHFRKFLEQGKDILHLSLSSGISGTVESAHIAASALAPEYPDRKIYIVDSLAASSGYGLLMATLAEKRSAGMGIDELHEWAENQKLCLRHWFFSSDLTFFIKGGRVKPAAGFVGNLLGICPLLDVDQKGCLIPREKIRSKKKVIKRIVEQMEMTAENGLDYNGRVFISESACPEDAREVADLIERRFKKMTGKVEIFSIGTTIGSHTGPGTVALFFWGTERVQ